MMLPKIQDCLHLVSDFPSLVQYNLESPLMFSQFYYSPSLAMMISLCTQFSSIVGE